MEFSTGFAFSDLAARSISHWPLEASWIELHFPLQILNKVDDTVGIAIHSPLGIAANMLLNLRAISPVITKQYLLLKRIYTTHTHNPYSSAVGNIDCCQFLMQKIIKDLAVQNIYKQIYCKHLSSTPQAISRDNSLGH